MTIQHLLVATDFSADADQALDYAIALAIPLQARVTLLHAISAVFWGTGDVAMAPPTEYFDALETEAQQQIEQACTRVREAGLEGETIVVYGVPFECIITAARHHNIDLIVMGTHGRTGLRHVLLGSVAERVVRLAPCPVLVTRRTTPPSP